MSSLALHSHDLLLVVTIKQLLFNFKWSWTHKPNWVSITNSINSETIFHWHDKQTTEIYKIKTKRCQLRNLNQKKKKKTEILSTNHINPRPEKQWKVKNWWNFNEYLQSCHSMTGEKGLIGMKNDLLLIPFEELLRKRLLGYGFEKKVLRGWRSACFGTALKWERELGPEMKATIAAAMATHCSQELCSQFQRFCFSLSLSFSLDVRI